MKTHMSISFGTLATCSDSEEGGVGVDVDVAESDICGRRIKEQSLGQ